jgi:hypothetical protein
MMPRLRCLIISSLTLWLIYFTPPSFSGEVLAIIVQPSSAAQSLSFEMLKRIFLRKSMLDDSGIPWIPLNLPISHELRQGLSLALLKQRPEDLEDYWNTQYFHGINPPYILMSEEAMLRFVAITPGAIGYVRQRSVDARVKVIKLISLPGDI